MLRATIRKTGVSIAMQTGGLPAELPAGSDSELLSAAELQVVGLVAGDDLGAAGQAPARGAGLESAVGGENVVALVAPGAERRSAPAEEQAWAEPANAASASMAATIAMLSRPRGPGIRNAVERWASFGQILLFVARQTAWPSGPSWQLSHLTHERETSDFAPPPRDRFALIQLTYVLRSHRRRECAV